MKRSAHFVTIFLMVFLTTGIAKAGFYDDNDFDGSDLAVLAAAYGSATGAPAYNSDADFSDDGDVDTADLELFASLLGRTDCEPPEAIKEIGTEGGVVRVYDTESPIYRAKVEIPDGAITSEASCVYISNIDESQLPSFPESWQSIGQSIEAGPEGTAFEKPVKVFIPYDDADHDGIVDGTNVLETSLTVVTGNYDSQECETVEATVDEENNQVILWAYHFSWFDLISRRWPSNSTITYNIVNTPSITDDSIDDIKQAIRSAFAVWQQELNKDPANITFQEIASSETADISLSWISHVTSPTQLYTINLWPNPQWPKMGVKIYFHDNYLQELGANNWSASLDPNDWEPDTVYVKRTVLKAIGEALGFPNMTEEQRTHPLADSSIMQSHFDNTSTIFANHQVLSALDIFMFRVHYAVPYSDNDDDKVTDEIDNCPSIYNPDQADADGDGVGDGCEIACAVDRWDVKYYFNGSRNSGSSTIPLTEMDISQPNCSEIISASVTDPNGATHVLTCDNSFNQYRFLNYSEILTGEYEFVVSHQDGNTYNCFDTYHEGSLPIPEVNLSNGVVTNTVTPYIDWHEVTGAARYWLRFWNVSRTEIIYESRDHIGYITDTHHTVPAGYLEPSTPYILDIHAADDGFEHGSMLRIFLFIDYSENPETIESVAVYSEVFQYDPSRFSLDPNSPWYNSQTLWIMSAEVLRSGGPPFFPAYLESPVYSDTNKEEAYELLTVPDFTTYYSLSHMDFYDWLGFSPPGSPWENKTYTFFIDANENGQRDAEEATRDWIIPPDSLKELSIPQNVNISGGYFPTISWEPLPGAHFYSISMFSLLPSGNIDWSVQLDAIYPIIGQTSYTYNGDLFKSEKEYAVCIWAFEYHPFHFLGDPSYNGRWLNRSGYFTKYQNDNFPYDTWSTPQAIVENDNNISAFSIAVDPTGNWHVVYDTGYSELVAPSTNDIHYFLKYFNNNNMSPVTIAQSTVQDYYEPLNMSKTGQSTSKPSIAVDSGGGLHVVYELVDYDSSTIPTSKKIMYMNNASGSWSTPQAIVENDNNISAFSIAVDPTGNWHVVYDTGYSELVAPSTNDIHYFLKYFNNNNMSPVTIAQSTVQDYYEPLNMSKTGQSTSKPSIAVDSGGGLHVVYELVDYDSSTIPTSKKIMYMNNASGSWSTPQAIVENDNNISAFSIAVDPTGNWHVVYDTGYSELVAPSTNDIHYFLKYFNNNNMSPVTIAQSTVQDYYEPLNMSKTGQSTSKPSIAVDSGGGLHVVYELVDYDSSTIPTSKKIMYMNKKQ